MADAFASLVAVYYHKEAKIQCGIFRKGVRLAASA